MLDMPWFSGLAGQATQLPKLVIYFWVNPKGLACHVKKIIKFTLDKGNEHYVI